MKISIAIAILLNVYGVLASPHLFKSSPEFEDEAYENPHPKHHHRHHNDSHDDTLTTDDLADVLLSLPGSMGKQAYKTFLSLGQFLPAETKAHKFFKSIPKAIKHKSNGRFSDFHNYPREQPSVNPIFMMQPTGYNMMPLPLHPMFSSSPMDYYTRVPCRHTKVIRVPLHTFDLQISATTHRFKPAQSLYDDSDDSDDDMEDDNGLKDLLDLISGGISDDESKPTPGGPSENNVSEETGEADNKTPEVNNTEINPSEDVTPKGNDEEPLPQGPAEPSPQNPAEPSPQDPVKPTIEAENTDEKPVESVKPEEAVAEGQPPNAEAETPPNQEEQEPVAGSQEPAEPTEAQQAESVEAPVVEKSDKTNKKKKGPQKKAKKAPTEPESEPTEVQEPESVPAQAPAEEETPFADEITKPIQTKRVKRKKPKNPQGN